MAFERTVSLQDLWDGEMRGLAIGGTKVLLLRLEDAVYAYADRCAHLGIALSAGKLEHGVIECGAHRFQYDARTGKGINPRTVSLQRYPVRIGDGAVWVDVDAPIG